MKHYLFIVEKRISLSTLAYDYWNVSNRYPVTVPDGAEIDLNKYATMLVHAERCISSTLTSFPRVIALEITPGEPVSIETPAHLFVWDHWEQFSPDKFVYGIRDVPMIDPFCGIEFGENRATGSVIKQFMPHSFSLYDAPQLRPGEQRAKHLLLDTDSDLATMWFPMYCSILAKLEFLDRTVSVQTDGTITELMPITDAAPILCHASLLGDLRRRMKRRPHDHMFWEDNLEYALNFIRWGYFSMRDSLKGFGYNWGDGAFPNLRVALGHYDVAIGTWHSIAYGLGYNIPDSNGHAGRELFQWTTNDQHLGPEFGTVATEGATIEKAIQWWYAVEKDFTGNNFITRYPSPGGPDDHKLNKPLALRLYHDWDIWGEDLKALVRAVALIRATVRIKPGPRPVNPTKIPNPNFNDYVQLRKIPIDGLELFPFVRVTIPDHGPFLTTPGKDSVYVHLPKPISDKYPVYTPEPEHTDNPWAEPLEFVEAAGEAVIRGVLVFSQLPWDGTDEIPEVGGDWATDLLEEAPEIVTEI